MKNTSASEGDIRDMGLIPGLGRSAAKRPWQAIPLFLPEEEPGGL